MFIYKPFVLFEKLFSKVLKNHFGYVIDA